MIIKMPRKSVHDMCKVVDTDYKVVICDNKDRLRGKLTVLNEQSAFATFASPWKDKDVEFFSCDDNKRVMLLFVDTDEAGGEDNVG